MHAMIWSLYNLTVLIYQLGHTDLGANLGNEVIVQRA
jgi:hypothetical protein